MLDTLVIPPWLPCGRKMRTPLQAGGGPLRSQETEARKGKNKPQRSILVNTDGKLAAVTTDVVHGL